MEQYSESYQDPRMIGAGLLDDPSAFSDYAYPTAATAAMFAPGSGVADLMGLAPDPTRAGEMLPSFYENVTGGNYMDAGLQALGGAGDVLQAGGILFPPVAAVGTAAKAPRAAKVSGLLGDVSDTALARQIASRTGKWEMSPEEAALYEAAAQFQIPRTPGETERLPQMAYEYGARTQDALDKGLLIDPGFQNLKRAAPDANMPGTVMRDLKSLVDEEYIDLQGLIGRTGKLMPGDMTMAGQEITHVMGVKLKNPVRMQGGKDFPREKISKELGLVWASHPNVIAGYAKQARENPGLIGVYTAMGARSNDFSHHVADVLVDMTKQADWIPKQTIDSFDEKVRSFIVSKDLKVDGKVVKKNGKNVKVQTQPFKDFPGITSPDIEKYLYSEGKGGARKAVADIMEKSAFRDKGFPDVSMVRTIVSDPSMRNRVNDPTGQLSPTGARIVEFDADPMTPMKGRGNIPEFNKSYAQGISGQNLGTLQTPVPRILMAPEFFEGRRLAGKEPSSDRRSAEISNVLFPITQQKADDVSVFGDMFRRGLLGK